VHQVGNQPRFIICTPHQILFRRSNQGGWDRRGM